MRTSWVPSCVELCREFRGRETNCVIEAKRLICNKLLVASQAGSFEVRQ